MAGIKTDKPPRRQRAATLGLKRALGVKTTRLQTLWTDDTLKRLKAHCAHEGASVSVWLENFVRPFLLREGKGRAEFKLIVEAGESVAA
jgi:hypothetical protein